MPLLPGPDWASLSRLGFEEEPLTTESLFTDYLHGSFTPASEVSAPSGPIGLGRHSPRAEGAKGGAVVSAAKEFDP